MEKKTKKAEKIQNEFKIITIFFHNVPISNKYGYMSYVTAKILKGFKILVIITNQILSIFLFAAYKFKIISVLILIINKYVHNTLSHFKMLITYFIQILKGMSILDRIDIFKIHLLHII